MNEHCTWTMNESKTTCTTTAYETTCKKEFNLYTKQDYNYCPNCAKPINFRDEEQ